MENFLREWRQNALNKAQHDAAIFVGDKLLAMTKDDNDAFWLAQVHFAAGNYTRAQSLLNKQDLVSKNSSCRYLAAHCLIRQGRHADAIALLGEQNPTHLIPGNAKRRMARGDGHGHSHGHGHGHGHGASKPEAASSSSSSSSQDLSEDELADRRYEAGMCYLRGLCYAKQNAFDRAKDCYKTAVFIDVQCFEALSELTKNQLMSPDEEAEFLATLDYSFIQSEKDDGDLKEEPANYIRMLYDTQLSKYRSWRTWDNSFNGLTTHYGLENNADVLLSQADWLYTQCRFQEALAITDSILLEDQYNFSAYPVHLACLYELRKVNSLFLIAHQLADAHPEQACTYHAIGVYYFSIDRIAEARRFFSKASMMNANFGPAWIGFAHTFAVEGEHDQAISAYSTAARLFQGTHLPQVFLGMQHHATNNFTTADEFLKTAYNLCKNDPLLLNEMGIVRYHQDKLDDAVAAFQQALKIIEDTDTEPQVWLGTRTNLAHAYRRLRRYGDALHEFDTVLRDGGKDAHVFCAKGLIYLDLNRPDEAIDILHEALAIHPQDPIATELLNKALDVASAARQPVALDSEDMDAFEVELAEKKMQAKGRIARHADAQAARKKGKGKAVAVAAKTAQGRRTFGRLAAAAEDSDDGVSMDVVEDEDDAL
ncbi:hypothetical protein P8C59_002814 [Phyllachora maydis]|uniref:Anaphase-promoting complex subunit cut9 n=1 Tax=Phyllachora maydis TaxID=1825666 RepID=A0AAD9HZ90_9PEZI|nr:hypothetical protein P8C59_002814 [Phyllachora maydis]